MTELMYLRRGYRRMKQAVELANARGLPSLDTLHTYVLHTDFYVKALEQELAALKQDLARQPEKQEEK